MTAIKYISLLSIGYGEIFFAFNHSLKKLKQPCGQHSGLTTLSLLFRTPIINFFKRLELITNYLCFNGLVSKNKFACFFALF
jgi:hypothetical protein